MVASLTMDVNLGKLWETVRNREVWHAAVHGVKRVGHDLVTEQQQYEGKSVLHCIRSLKTLLTGSESEKYLFQFHAHQRELSALPIRLTSASLSRSSFHNGKQSKILQRPDSASLRTSTLNLRRDTWELMPVLPAQGVFCHITMFPGHSQDKVSRIQLL